MRTTNIKFEKGFEGHEIYVGVECSLGNIWDGSDNPMEYFFNSDVEFTDFLIDSLENLTEKLQILRRKTNMNELIITTYLYNRFY